MTKLRVLWNVLRGRPTMYRVHFSDTVHIGDLGDGHVLVAECEIDCDPGPGPVRVLQEGVVMSPWVPWIPMTDSITWTGGDAAAVEEYGDTVARINCE